MNLEEGHHAGVRSERRFESFRSSITTNGMVSKCSHSPKKIFENHEGPLGSLILMLCVISICLDPLFLYIPVINEHKSCIALDKELGVTACVLRSIIDFIYVIYIGFQLCTDFSHGVGSYSVTEHARPIDWKLLCYGIVDLLAVLPLPQVVIIIVIAMRGLKFLNAMKFLKYFVFFQYVPRVIRIYPLVRNAMRTLGIFAEAAWSKAAFNFLLYVVAGHVYGALWYFLAIERELKCWNNACKSHTGCVRDSIDCNESSKNHVFFNDFCFTDKKIYDFGLFHDAVESGILEKRNFLHKFMYCFKWGLQSLSCFGQNLVTSTDFWENVFTICITLTSILMFIFLIGNMQIYLQVKTTRSEEMKLKLRDIERWTPFKTLPTNLKEKVKSYQQHVWQKTRGVDVENLLRSLPEDLRKEIKYHLRLKGIMRVPIFKKMDSQLIEIMFDRLKSVQYKEEECIVQKGDRVNEMLFIVRGNLMSTTANGERYLHDGDFCGEELIPWALHSSSCDHPPSTGTIKALSVVEAYALIAEDLKFAIACQFRWPYRKESQRMFRFYSQQQRTWAACSIQTAWRTRFKNEHKESLRPEEDRLEDSLANVSESTPSLGATTSAS